MPPSATGCPSLALHDVRMAFPTPKGEYVAIQDIDLEIRRHEFITFIGHSGCGKSTLLSILAGLYRATSGTVLLDGLEIEGPGPDRGVVFQSYSLLPWLTVYDNVWQAVDSVHYHTMTKPEMAARTESVLKAVGLWEHRKKHPPHLSGGMKQRVAIARAFAIEPKVLLLDEPFGALDALTRGSLQDELLNLWSHTRRVETVVMVTHDIDEAIYLSDRIVVFSDGPAATIQEILPVTLERPRDRRRMVHTPAYAELKDRLMELLVCGSSAAQGA
jgi:nitrate/nitrite transport system ATP-binding protein